MKSAEWFRTHAKELYHKEGEIEVGIETTNGISRSISARLRGRVRAKEES